MFDKWGQKKILKILGIYILAFLVVVVIIVFLFYFCVVLKYNDVVYPNTYLGEYKISDVGFAYLDKRIEFYSDSILNTTVTFKAHDKEYKYTFRSLGLEIDKAAIIEEIKEEQEKLSYTNRLARVSGKEKQVYHYKLKYNRNYLTKILTEIKKEVDVNLVYDDLVMSSDRVLSYVPGIEGYSLNVSDSVDRIIEALDNRMFHDLTIELVGEVTEANKNQNLAVIDTKVSSFSTEFNPYITRAINLRTALNYIDGAIIWPGEVFSFFNYAGPYDKEGYVFYYEFVGNGVCQIATTVYNAALLGGLEIVKRYPHKAKSVYVPGGLDATVASYSSGWNVDMQFRNTYDYPIYISAYAVGGTVYVDFWSNHDAKKGRSYATSSIQIGERGYTSFLHVYLDGEEIEKRKIATTWYSE